MDIALQHFEQIDSQLTAVLRFPPFQIMTHAECKGYISASNILLDYCIEATSYDFANSFSNAEECAAAIVAGGLLGTINVVDEVSA